MTIPMFEYSITCAGCGAKFQSTQETPFQHLAAAQAKGWQAPMAIENKKIFCPTCKDKP